LRLLVPLLADNRKTVLGGLNAIDGSPTRGDDERYDPHIHRISFVSPSLNDALSLTRAFRFR
jgi:hypothetical protein